MRQSKMRTKLLAPFMAALMFSAILASAAQAAETPAPGFDRFAGCPSPEEDSEIALCIHSVVTGGHFKMGSKNVPITNPITVSGGTAPELEGFKANSKGGLTPVKQQVPGGVIGLTGLDWLVNFLNVEALKLYAVTELAGTPQVGFETLSLPIKVHLVNPALGSKCYVGSTSNPIMLNMTVGTTSPPPPNQPITGVVPDLTIDELGVIHVENGTYVDNAFAAPSASGCQLTLLGFIPVDLDGLVNFQAGLPSAAGTNETAQEIDTEIADRPLVYP